MLVGAALSHFLTPETTQKDGRSRTLEDLAGGKKRRKELELEESAAGDSSQNIANKIRSVITRRRTTMQDNDQEGGKEE